MSPTREARTLTSWDPPAITRPDESGRVAQPVVDNADQSSEDPPVFWILNNSSVAVRPKPRDMGVTLILAGVAEGGGVGGGAGEEPTTATIITVTVPTEDVNRTAD